MSLSLPALERLLGGDTEMEVELREQVANAFATRHLKSLLNTKVAQDFQATISEEVDAAIKKRVARVERKGWKSEVHLGGHIREKITEAVDEVATDVFNQETIAELVNEKVKDYERNVAHRVGRAIDKALSDRKIDELVRERVQRRLEAAIKIGECDPRNGKERERVIDV